MGPVLRILFWTFFMCFQVSPSTYYPESFLYCYTHGITVNLCTIPFVKPITLELTLLHESSQINPPDSGEILNGIGAWVNEKAIPSSDLRPVATLLPLDNVRKPMLHVFFNESATEQSWSHVTALQPK